METKLLWIPLLPFLGFLLNGLAGKRLSRPVVSLVACLGPGLAAVLAALAFFEVALPDRRTLVCPLWDWIRVVGSEGSVLSAPFSLSLDRLSGVMALVVTGVGTLIHIYSTGYMKDDPGHARFFAYLNLFMAAMLILILADNILLLFLGWEGVGLCSYLLIGFWYQDLANCQAGLKAFIVNRIGDFGFLLGIFLIFTTCGTFQFNGINAAAFDLAGDSTLFWIALLLFVGATGKSAQIPLHVWLPDAMAGPTPVSALIHAATMVTSGVYMVARLGPLFAASGVLPIVAWIGALTALLGALIALTQTDIKRVLAYSTVSQLGYMFLAAGLGQFGVAIFHVVTHAFFKALLFLGAGAVIHSLHHEQDMRKMGGLLKKLPLTGALFFVGALALAGFPLTAGFFSKDEILHEAFHAHAYVLWSIGLITAVLTAFYAFRQFSMVFLGEYRGGTAHPGAHGEPEIHESPPSMLAPLVILALLALVGGFLAVPHFLEPSRPEATWSELLPGWIIGGAAALVGIGAALFLWKRPEILERARATAPGRKFHHLSLNKFFVDEAYAVLFVKPFPIICMVLHYLVDRLLIDWLLVGGTSLFVSTTGYVLRRLQSGRIPTYTAYVVAGALGILSLVVWAAR